MKISTLANNVLGEFGSVIPDALLSFEDVKRSVVRVRALEMQKLGIADTDRTSRTEAFNVSAREGNIPSSLGDDIMPAAVEWMPTGNQNYREKVEIVPLEAVSSYEGSRAIAFYGTSPMRYKLSFDTWQNGQLWLTYDPIEDFDALTGASNAIFPPNFVVYLESKSALDVIGIIQLKLAMKSLDEFPNTEQITAILNGFTQRLMLKVGEWELEFRKWRNKDYNESPRMRRTFDEIYSQDYNNVTGNRAGDFDG